MSSTQRRVTMHNARKSKVDGHVFTPKHNDRDFDLDKAAHIDQGRQAENYYWNCYGQGSTFEEAEKRYYQEHFSAALEARNQAAIAARHPERVITLDEYRKAARTCPEEQIVMLGDKHQQHDRQTYLRILREQLAWERERFPQAVTLNVALHLDEQGGAHFHVRRVWVGHDQAGREVVGQSKALAEMGVEPPDQGKAYGRHNNAKMTYTAECRAHLQELCRAYGLEIETKPRERGKQGRSQAEYVTEQQEARLERAQEDLILTEHERDRAAEERDRLEAQNAQQAARNEELRAEGADLAAEIGRQEVLASTARGNAQQAKKIEQRAREATQRAIEEAETKQAELAAIDGQILTARQAAAMEGQHKKTLDGKYYKVPVQEYKDMMATVRLVEAAQDIVTRQDQIIERACAKIDRTIEAADIDIREYQRQAIEAGERFKATIRGTRERTPIMPRQRSRSHSGPGGRGDD